MRSPTMYDHATEALANIVTATVAECNALANHFMATNERLTAHIEQLTKQLAESVTKIITIEKTIDTTAIRHS